MYVKPLRAEPTRGAKFLKVSYMSLRVLSPDLGTLQPCLTEAPGDGKERTTQCPTPPATPGPPRHATPGARPSAYGTRVRTGTMASTPARAV